jgi:predicted RNA methylase
VDPSTGTGILTVAAQEAGYDVVASDIHDWGFRNTHLGNFLVMPPEDAIASLVKGNTVLMNPPFSKAVEFVQKALDLGARKIVCFQRFAWWESRGRREFWERHPPNRVYICGDRATCWRHDIAEEKRNGAGTTTAHAWFVWEKGHPFGTQLGHIYREAK